MIVRMFAAAGSSLLRCTILASGTFIGAGLCVPAVLAAVSERLDVCEILWKLPTSFTWLLLLALTTCLLATVIALVRRDHVWMFGILALLLFAISKFLLPNPTVVIIDRW